MYHHAKTWTGMGGKMAANGVPGKFKFEYTGSRCWVWIRRVYLHPTHCRNNATPTFATKQGRNCPNIYNRSNTSLRSIFLGHLANWLHRVCITSTLTLIYIIKHCNNRSDFLWGSFETMFTGSVSHNIEDIFLTFLAFARCALVSLRLACRASSSWLAILVPGLSGPPSCAVTLQPLRPPPIYLIAQVDKSLAPTSLAATINSQFLTGWVFPRLSYPNFRQRALFFQVRSSKRAKRIAPKILTIFCPWFDTETAETPGHQSFSLQRTK